MAHDYQLLLVLVNKVLLGHSHSHLVEGGTVAKNLPTNIEGCVLVYNPNVWKSKINTCVHTVNYFYLQRKPIILKH